MPDEKVICDICKKEVLKKNTDVSYIGGFRYCISHSGNNIEFNKYAEEVKRGLK